MTTLPDPKSTCQDLSADYIVFERLRKEPSWGAPVLAPITLFAEEPKPTEMSDLRELFSVDTDTAFGNLAGRSQADRQTYEDCVLDGNAVKTPQLRMVDDTNRYHRPEYWQRRAKISIGDALQFIKKLKVVNENNAVDVNEFWITRILEAGIATAYTELSEFYGAVLEFKLADDAHRAMMAGTFDEGALYGISTGTVSRFDDGGEPADSDATTPSTFTLRIMPVAEPEPEYRAATTQQAMKGLDKAIKRIRQQPRLSWARHEALASLGLKRGSGMEGWRLLEGEAFEDTIDAIRFSKSSDRIADIVYRVWFDWLIDCVRRADTVKQVNAMRKYAAETRIFGRRAFSSYADASYFWEKSRIKRARMERRILSGFAQTVMERIVAAVTRAATPKKLKFMAWWLYNELPGQPEVTQEAVEVLRRRFFERRDRIFGKPAPKMTAPSFSDEQLAVLG